MASQTITSGADAESHLAASSDRFGGWCAALAGIGGLFYAIAFVIISRSDPALGGFLSALFLALNGLLTTSVMATLYDAIMPAANDTYYSGNQNSEVRNQKS